MSGARPRRSVAQEGKEVMPLKGGNKEGNMAAMTETHKDLIDGNSKSMQAVS